MQNTSYDVIVKASFNAAPNDECMIGMKNRNGRLHCFNDSNN